MSDEATTIETLKAEWKDVTSFSRSDTDRTPRTWEIRIGDIRVLVTRKWLGKGYSETGWSVWHVESEPFLRYNPEGNDIDAIKATALFELKLKLIQHISRLEATHG